MGAPQPELPAGTDVGAEEAISTAFVTDDYHATTQTEPEIDSESKSHVLILQKGMDSNSRFKTRKPIKAENVFSHEYQHNCRLAARGLLGENVL